MRIANNVREARTSLLQRIWSLRTHIVNRLTLCLQMTVDELGLVLERARAIRLAAHNLQLDVLFPPSGQFFAALRIRGRHIDVERPQRTPAGVADLMHDATLDEEQRSRSKRVPASADDGSSGA